MSSAIKEHAMTKMCLVLKFDSIVKRITIFTCDGSVSAVVKLHAHNKLCQVSKFMSIIRKNNDVLFIVKKTFV